MSKKEVESNSSPDEPDNAENQNEKKEELKDEDTMGTAAESLQSTPGPSQAGSTADSEGDSSELTPVTKLSGQLGMLSTKSQTKNQRQTPRRRITYSSDEMGVASPDSSGKSVSWDSPTPIDSPTTFEGGSDFMNKSKSFPQINRRSHFNKPKNLTERLSMAHASKATGFEDGNSDSMFLLQAFVDGEGSQGSNDKPQASPQPQGFQGLLHSQGSLGAQTAQEDQDVAMETNFKVPPVNSRWRSLFGDVSEDGSDPSRPGCAKRVHSDDVPGGGSASSRSRKRLRFNDNPGDDSGPSSTSSRKKLRFCDKPGGGSGPSRAESSKRLFSDDKPGDDSGPSSTSSRKKLRFCDKPGGGSGPSRAESSKRLFSDDKPGDDSGPSSTSSRKKLRFCDKPGDGSGPSHAGSSKRLFSDDKPGDGSDPSRAGSSKRLFSDDKPGDGSGPSRSGSSKRLFSDDKPGDGSGPSRAGSSKRLFSDDKPGDGSGPSHAGSSKRLFSDDKPGDGSGPSHAGSSKRLFSDDKPGDGSGPSLAGSSKRSPFSDSSEDDGSPSKKSMKTNGDSSPRAWEETPGGLSGLMEKPATSSSDFFAVEKTPPAPSGVGLYEEEDENTPVRKYGKAKRAMLRSQSMIVESRTQGFGHPIPTPNLSPGTLQRRHSASEASIKDAVHRMTEDPNLLADSSKSCLLPTISGKHQDLKSISHDTLADLIHGKYAEEVEGFHIVDCRYPYEYEGGHIKNAINIFTQTELLDRYIQNVVKIQDRNKRFFLIFHCEFSSERGPTLFRYLRKTDRHLNSDRYPHLFYPEIYLLEKGYSHFFEFHKDLCEPQNYIRMLDENFKEELVKYEEEKKKAGSRKKTSSLNLGGGGNRRRTPAAFRSLNQDL